MSEVKAFENETYLLALEASVTPRFTIFLKAHLLDSHALLRLQHLHENASHAYPKA